MPASYPSSIFAFTTVNNGDTSDASQIDNPVAEIIAVETGLISGLQHALLPLTNNLYALGSSAKRWSKVWTQDLDIAGTLTMASGLAVPSGGTGATTLTAHGVLLGEGAGAIVATAVGTTGQVLTGVTGADPTFQALTSLVLDKSTTEQDVVNTATETSVYSFSVPGGTLGTAKALRLTMIGDYLNNTGGNTNLFIAVKFGGTVVAGANSSGGAVGGGGYASNASPHAVKLETIIAANGATNSQRINANLIVAAAQADVAWGATSETTEHQTQHTTLTVDTTSAQTLTVTIQHGSANAALSFKRFAVYLELLG